MSLRDEPLSARQTVGKIKENLVEKNLLLRRKLDLYHCVVIFSNTCMCLIAQCGVGVGREYAADMRFITKPLKR